MCGIVGYLGSFDASTPVLEGLSRLEYRGYDSAGISYILEDGIKTFKKEGKLTNLQSILDGTEKNSHLAIGHTRWATHGEVNDINAHPHENDTFAIVHNGIIENATKIKAKLEPLGYKFVSQTDTESFLNLLTYYFKEFDDVKSAVTKAFEEVEGNSSFVIIHKNENKIWSIRRSAPLVVGMSNKNEVLVSSDPYALVGFADKIYFPEDNVLVVGDLTSNSLLSFEELDGSESTRYKLQAKEIQREVVTKGHFEHYMLKEIHEQPALIHSLASFYINGEGREALDKVGDFDFSHTHIIACGTALHAGMSIKNFLESINGKRVSYDFASEFRYRNLKLNKNELGLFISQSGETADTLACQELCKAQGLQTNSIVNVEGSTLYRECDKNLLINAGVEIGVASTKAFTQQVLVGLLLSKSIEGKLDDPELLSEFTVLSSRVSELLKNSVQIEKIAEAIYQKNGFIFTGRGEQFPIALEGALKLKEIAYVHAEGYAAGELKHGPISLIDKDMVNIAIITPDLYEKTLSNAQEVKARRGILVTVGEKGNKELEEISDHFVGLDFDGLKLTKPVYTNIVLQLLSYYVAKLKGTDIDKPRNLAKSVTVE